MSSIIYGIIEISFLLSSCYLLNKYICSSPIKSQNEMNEYYYIIPVEEYEKFKNKQPQLADVAVAPPEYKAVADEPVSLHNN
jgi:hypothetical protein